eukprot:CAMPEP_0118674966 /NCGR_PEP_ID=MMETSP0800-20121206/1181_1 /TAXON_ID=210618 ORGANISM="Striatella unipunctata, Strain CCMP2910" /NCGR_SAMPLE_ID=MMETSP0800 /ASSEMBLY_ACC=CAM_ASM_000638 /LENGTH=230 /DNA_ID=CAMNT_0006570219 /DNA_START=165 /DNA_END=857 /DNA_ORIENTATION=-
MEGQNTTMLEAISALPGWGTKSANNLAKAAQATSTNGISSDRFVYALGIRHVGVHASKLIASAYGSVNAFLASVEQAQLNQSSAGSFPALFGDEKQEGIKGLGPAVKSSLEAFAQSKILTQAARDLADIVVVHSHPTKPNTVEGSSQSNVLPFQDLAVVFTGSLKGISRKEAQKMAIELGAKSTPNSVSSSTGVVVAGDKSGKKAKEAVELGVRLMAETEFLSIVTEYKK